MEPRLQLAIDAILNAVVVLDDDANPAVTARRFNEALAPALDDMREPESTNPNYFVSAATSIIRELMESIATNQGVTKRDIAEVLRTTYQLQAEDAGDEDLDDDGFDSDRPHLV